MRFPALLPIVLAWAAFGAPLDAETAAHTIAYHSQDIVNIRAKVRYTTLIQLPSSEKIIEAATGDKEFWIIDVVGSFCFVHPAKAGIRSNLNLITDKGNIYSFTLEDVSNENADPDLKVIVQPADSSSIAASTGPAQFVQGEKMLLEENGYRVLTATNGKEAVQAFTSHSVDLVLLDYYMPEMNGGMAAVRMKDSKPDVPVAILSSDECLPLRELEAVDCFIPKSEPIGSLLEKVDYLLSLRFLFLPIGPFEGSR
jgi:CheY-like chemotaxis protein